MFLLSSITTVFLKSMLEFLLKQNCIVRLIAYSWQLCFMFLLNSINCPYRFLCQYSSGCYIDGSGTIQHLKLCIIYLILYFSNPFCNSRRASRYWVLQKYYIRICKFHGKNCPVPFGQKTCYIHNIRKNSIYLNCGQW